MLHELRLQRNPHDLIALLSPFVLLHILHLVAVGLDRLRRCGLHDLRLGLCISKLLRLGPLKVMLHGREGDAIDLHRRIIARAELLELCELGGEQNRLRTLRHQLDETLSLDGRLRDLFLLRHVALLGLLLGLLLRSLNRRHSHLLLDLLLRLGWELHTLEGEAPVEEREVLVLLLEREPRLICVGVAEERGLDQLVAILLQDLHHLAPGNEVFLNRALEALQLHRDLLAELLRPALALGVVLADLTPDRLRAPEDMSRRPEEELVDLLAVHARPEEDALAVRRQIADEGAEGLLTPARIVDRELAGDGIERLKPSKVFEVRS